VSPFERSESTLADHADTLSENMLQLPTPHKKMTVNAGDYHLRLSAVVAGRPLGRPIIFFSTTTTTTTTTTASGAV